MEIVLEDFHKFVKKDKRSGCINVALCHGQDVKVRVLDIQIAE
jgi:hypothetical protein